MCTPSSKSHILDLRHLGRHAASADDPELCVCRPDYEKWVSFSIYNSCANSSSVLYKYCPLKWNAGTQSGLKCAQLFMTGAQDRQEICEA